MHTHVWNDDCELGVECVVHFADGSFITPEWVVVLRILGVRISRSGEYFIPGCGIGVRLRNAVWRLPGTKIREIVMRSQAG